jgi:hypothetical protein
MIAANVFWRDERKWSEKANVSFRLAFALCDLKRPPITAVALAVRADGWDFHRGQTFFAEEQRARVDPGLSLSRIDPPADGRQCLAIRRRLRLAVAERRDIFAIYGNPVGADCFDRSPVLFHQHARIIEHSRDEIGFQRVKRGDMKVRSRAERSCSGAAMGFRCGSAS